jgi:hypothetical protein
MVVANVAPIRWAAAAAVNASAERRTRVWWEWVSHSHSQQAGGCGKLPRAESNSARTCETAGSPAAVPAVAAQRAEATDR